MFKNYLYVEQGPELQCHQKLYKDGFKKKEKIQKFEYQKQLQALIEQVNEIDEEYCQKKPTKDFYNYSMRWKNQVEQRRFQEQYANEISQTLKSTNNQIQKLPQNYISPIDGWKEHAQQYFDKRETKEMQKQSCSPMINERSRMMTYDEPVEDRLIRYGQQREQKYLFEKQFEKFYEEVQKSQRPTKPNEEVFDRLYNYERKIPEPETYSLSLNKLTPELEEKVKKRREQYNLFDCKSRATTEAIDKEIKVISQNEFDEFLKRNFARHYRVSSLTDESQENYSFRPELNKKSIDLANKQGDNLIERQEKFLQKKQAKQQQLLEQQKQYEETQMIQNKPKAKIHTNAPKNKSPLRPSTYNLQNIIKQKVPDLF